MTRRGHAGQLVLLFWALWDLFCAPLRHYAPTKRLSSSDDDVGYLPQPTKMNNIQIANRFRFAAFGGNLPAFESEDRAMKKWYSMISSDDYWTRTGHDKRQNSPPAEHLEWHRFCIQHPPRINQTFETEMQNKRREIRETHFRKFPL